ncbi:MAG: selenocysteine-specific translation elongation factor [Gemmatimonadota bacterium]|nr:selenocysteine-specific translation elongation factor [Gemmatimonadota bacterium]
MERHVVIGTAGHVDHGKTSLVKALTGVDTDRWEEEKKRGITIDLGFAHLQLDDGLDASIVDVPGHEDFVRNMVAGATGIDMALLVVAADEGIMPQTSEHLAILQFLGITSGIIAVTKADLVDSEWLDLVVEDISELLNKTKIKWEKPVAVSTVSGQGVEELRNSIASVARSVEGRSQTDLFRMPVDRSFSVAGAGTVVTGTTWAGTVSSGETVRLLPKNTEARLRNVEVHGRTEGKALPGRRTALALVGVPREDAGRGSVVVADPSWKETYRIDVRIDLLPDVKPLTQRSRVRIHLGTAEVMARMTPTHREIRPGETGVARLRLEAPLVARFGDLGVVRSYSPVTTIGGFRVIDPWPPARPGRPSDDDRRWAQDPAARIEAVVRLSPLASVKTSDLPVRAGIPPNQIDEVLEGITSRKLVVLDGTLFLQAVIETQKKLGLAELEAFHRTSPLEPGMPLEAFRQSVGVGPVADHILETLKGTGRIVAEKGTLRLAEFTSTLEGTDRELGEKVETLLREAGQLGITAGEVSENLPDGDALDLLNFLNRCGKAVKVGTDRFYDPEILKGLVKKVVNSLRREGTLTPADLKNELGLSRKYMIPLLEWLDNKGVTVRSGDGRRLGPKADSAI